MSRHVLRSVLWFVPVLYLVSLVVFLLVYLLGDPSSLLIPEDATEADRQRLISALGLDRPLHVQYLTYMGNILQGDFGVSYRYGSSALPVVLERLPATLELAAGAVVVGVVIAVPLGVLAATHHNRTADTLVSAGIVLGNAMPAFWLGIMLILVFAVHLGLLPVSGRGGFEHLVLPATTLGLVFAADLTKLVRSTLLESLGEDHVRTARARGVAESTVITRHALRPALIPSTTMLALHLIGLLGGALVTETVFSWPGLGQLLVQSISLKDMAVVQIAVFVIAVLALTINLFADVLYRVVDPRVRRSA